MINEGISVKTAGNMQLQFASEKHYIKQYIVYRFKKAGININIKRTYEKKNGTYEQKIDNIIFDGFTIRTYDKGAVSSGSKMVESNFDIIFSTMGNKVKVDFELYNQHIIKYINIDNTTSKVFMDKVISLYKEAKKELINKHKTIYKGKGGRDSIEKKLEDIANAFNYNGSEIIYRGGNNYSYRREEPEYHLIIKYGDEIKRYTDKTILGSLLVRLYKDPVVKRNMDKDDKVDKDYNFNFGSTAIKYDLDLNYTKKVIKKFVDYIDKQENVYIKGVVYKGLGVKVGYGKDESMKSYLVKRELIKTVIGKIKSMHYSLDYQINKASKYGKVIIKRFFKDPSKYINI